MGIFTSTTTFDLKINSTSGGIPLALYLYTVMANRAQRREPQALDRQLLAERYAAQLPGHHSTSEQCDFPPGATKALTLGVERVPEVRYL